MHILHLISFYVPAYRTGGPIFSVHTLNKALVAAGHKVTVFTTDMAAQGGLDVPLETPVDRDGVEVWYFPESFPRAWEYSAAMRSALMKRGGEFDVIHADSVFRAPVTLGASAAHRHRKPFMVSPRGAFMSEPLALRRSLLKKIYLELWEKGNLEEAALHFTTELEKKEYISAGLPLRKSFVIPNAFEVAAVARSQGEFRQKWGIPKDAEVVLSLGRIGWKKGFDTLIPAFGILHKNRPQARLVIAGPDDSYEKEVRTMVAKANLEDRVIFAGMIQPEDRIAALADGDIFVLPSYAENFGMAVVDAMYAGVPVAITPGVAIAREVERAGAGVVALKNPESFAEAMEELLSDPGRRAEMGKKGKNMVEKEFMPGPIAEQFVAAYNELIHDRQGA